MIGLGLIRFDSIRFVFVRERVRSSKEDGPLEEGPVEERGRRKDEMRKVVIVQREFLSSYLFDTAG